MCKELQKGFPKQTQFHSPKTQVEEFLIFYTKFANVNEDGKDIIIQDSLKLLRNLELMNKTC